MLTVPIGSAAATTPALGGQASGGPSPAQYLMAAADLKASGELSPTAPTPEGKDPVAASHRARKRLRMVK